MKESLICHHKDWKRQPISLYKVEQVVHAGLKKIISNLHGEYKLTDFWTEKGRDDRAQMSTAVISWIPMQGFLQLVTRTTHSSRWVWEPCTAEVPATPSDKKSGLRFDELQLKNKYWKCCGSPREPQQARLSSPGCWIARRFSSDALQASSWMASTAGVEIVWTLTRLKT